MRQLSRFIYFALDLRDIDEVLGKVDLLCPTNLLVLFGQFTDSFYQLICQKIAAQIDRVYLCFVLVPFLQQLLQKR